MIRSWFGDHSLKVPTKARLVEDGESEALRRKVESLQWKPENGFLRDHVQGRSEPDATRGKRAA
jgi:hypothetical protein